jgi:hypothetical protein
MHHLLSVAGIFFSDDTLEKQDFECKKLTLKIFSRSQYVRVSTVVDGVDYYQTPSAATPSIQ